MQAINFIYKVKKLSNKNNEIKTELRVFDSLQNVVISKIFFGEINNDEINYFLQTSEKLKYKNFTIYFTNNNLIKF